GRRGPLGVDCGDLRRARRTRTPGTGVGSLVRSQARARRPRAPVLPAHRAGTRVDPPRARTGAPDVARRHRRCARQPMIARVLRSIVRAIAPNDLRDALLDDLDEAFAREAGHRSSLGAAWWRMRQLASAVVEVIKLRRRRGESMIDDDVRPS